MPDAVIQPLEVFILDEDFKRLTGSIPYDSLIWHRRYYGVGEFQMQVRSSLYSTEWRYVYCEDRPETGVIQKVAYDDTTEGPRNGEDTVTISGFFLEELLNRLVFLVEEYETEEIKHIVPKPTKATQFPKPDFYQDADGNYYSIWKNGTINNLMTGEAARVEDSQELIDSLSPADVQPGKGIHEKVFHYEDGSTFASGMYSSAYEYVSDDGKVTIIDGRDNTRGEYDVVGDPSSGLVLYKDVDGSVKWVNGAVESHGDTYRRKAQRWESLQVDEDGNHYWMEYRDVEGPWMLRADIDDVKSPQDNVQWVLKMAEKVFQGNFIYDTPGFKGETKTLSPSLSRIGDFFYSELQSVEASLRVLYHFESDQMVFQLWRGLDRTQDGGGQTPATRAVARTAMLSADVADYPVPEGYTALEYIESTGTQYIDTGIAGGSDVRFTLDADVLQSNSSGDHHILTSAGSGQRVVLRITVGGGGYKARWGTSGLVEIPVEGEILSRHTFVLDGPSFRIDGSTPITFEESEFNTGYNMYLFASNNQGNATAFGLLKVYSLSIQNDSVSKNFVPAKRDSDGVVGIYDTIGGTFYGNSGTGEFVAGPEIERPPAAATLTYMPNATDVTGSMQVVSGVVGDTVEVALCQFLRDGYTFRIWNTRADGGGTDYAPLSEYTLTAGADVLFAQWDEVVEPPVPVPEGVGVPWAVFSDTWGTLYGYTASHDTSNYRNLAYVLYDYEEPVWDSSGNVALKKVLEYDDEAPSGTIPVATGYHYEVSSSTRRGYLTVRMEDDRPDAEVWIDRRSDSPDFMDGFETGEVEEGTTYDFTKADFDAWVESLKTDAESTLRNDYSDVDNLDTGTISTMRYLYDFDLGDKVDMAVEAIGMAKTARITEVEEVYESGSAEIHLTMGEELLTTGKKSSLV